MDDRNHIPMPTEAERSASIQNILDKTLTPAQPSWRELPLSALVFGVEDCLFLAVLLGLLPAALWLIPAPLPAAELPGILFLTSPLLYAAAHLLTLWKESQCGTLDWKRTCRLSLQTLTALRMMLFGGTAVLVCVPVDLLLWQASDYALPLTRMLGISFSSLFLYAALTLTLRHLRWGAAVPAVVWVLTGVILICHEPWMVLLLEVPAAAFFLAAGGGLVYCLSQLRRMLHEQNKGGFTYAFR